MAFIVEDGTAKADANAYCDVAFVDGYFADAGGHAAWDSADTAEKQAAIVKATRYIDQRFGRLFPNQRATRTQALEWPREWVDWPDGTLRFDLDDIPLHLQRACAEYAARALTAPLAGDPIESQQIIEQSVEVGPIKKTVRFADSSARKSSVVSNSALQDYPDADLWMETLLGSGSSMQLSRV